MTGTKSTRKPKSKTTRSHAKLPRDARARAGDAAKRGAGKRASAPRTSFFETYLKARGIDPAFARSRGVYFATRSDMQRDQYKPPLPAIVFKNINPVTGQRLASPARLQEPVVVVDKDGKKTEKKFIVPKDAIADPYRVEVDGLPPWKEIDNNTKIPIVLSEGPTRTLAGAQRGIAVWSGQGVDGFFEPGTKCTKLRADLERVNWKKRLVPISVDCDTATKRRVRDASDQLAKLLTEHHAVVKIVPAMRVTADGKSGIDDEFALGRHEGYLARCAAAPQWGETEHTGMEPEVRVLHEVDKEDIEWIWEGRIARKNVTMISGDPGTAKSFLAITLAAQYSLPSDRLSVGKHKPLRTLYATTENSAEQVIKPRFEAAGGNDHNLFLLDGARDESGVVSAITLGNLAPVEKAIVKHKIDLLIFDPLQSYFGTDADFNKANETRPRMDALTRLAGKHNIGVVIIRHLAKSSGGRAIHRGLGSIDFSGAVRIELMVGHAADRPNDRAIIMVQTNLGIFAPALDFSIEGEGMSARLAWKGSSTKTLADLQEPEKSKSTTGIVRAVQFLEKELSTGPKTREELLAASGGEFTEKMLERARKQTSGVVDSRRGARGPATWSLRKVTVN